MKRSYQTLEFWLSLAAMVVSVVSFAVGANMENAEASTTMKVLGSIGSVLAAMGYTGFRTVQKGNELKAKTAADLAKLAGVKPGNP